MAKFKNRGGVIWDFNPSDPEVLARVESGELFPLEEAPKPAPEPVPAPSEEELVEEESSVDLEDLQKKYEAKFEKAAPNAYKNDAEWLLKKLA